MMVVGMLTDSTFVFSVACFFCYLFFSLIFDFLHMEERFKRGYRSGFVPGRIVKIFSGLFIIMLFIDYWVVTEYWFYHLNNDLYESSYHSGHAPTFRVPFLVNDWKNFLNEVDELLPPLFSVYLYCLPVLTQMCLQNPCRIVDCAFTVLVPWICCFVVGLDIADVLILPNYLLYEPSSLRTIMILHHAVYCICVDGCLQFMILLERVPINILDEPGVVFPFQRRHWRLAGK